MNGSYRESGYFWLRRLHSIAGVILAMAFLVCYLIPYSFALGGKGPFDNLMAAVHGCPLLNWIVLIFVFLPLIVYMVMGGFSLYGSSANVVSYPFYRNWMYFFQRLTGLLIVPFIAYHIYVTYLNFVFTDRYADFAFLQKLFAPVWAKVFYSVGVACMAFHIGNGMATTLSQWGITVSRRSGEAASITMWCVTLILTAWGIRLIFAF